LKLFLDEMTWREANAAIKRRAPAFLPTGPVEGHGPHMPLGCDCHIAEAFSVVIARKCRGVVLPTLPYNYAGATSTFRGTVSVPIDVQVGMLKAIASSLWAQGFRSIFIVSVHGPNSIPIGNAVRTLFEDYRIPAVYLNPWPYFDDERIKEEVPRYDEPYKEAMLVFAAAQVLGKEDIIPDLGRLKNEEPPKEEAPTGLGTIQEHGMVGHHFRHELQHVPPRAGVKVELGLEAYELAATKMLPVVKALKAYVEWLDRHPRRWIQP